MTLACIAKRNSSLALSASLALVDRRSRRSQSIAICEPNPLLAARMQRAAPRRAADEERQGHRPGFLASQVLLDDDVEFGRAPGLLVIDSVLTLPP